MSHLHSKTVTPRFKVCDYDVGGYNCTGDIVDIDVTDFGSRCGHIGHIL